MDTATTIQDDDPRRPLLSPSTSISTSAQQRQHEQQPPNSPIVNITENSILISPNSDPESLSDNQKQQRQQSHSNFYHYALLSVSLLECITITIIVAVETFLLKVLQNGGGDTHSGDKANAIPIPIPDVLIETDLEMWIVSLLRTLLLVAFVFGNSTMVKFGIPMWTTFVEYFRRVISTLLTVMKASIVPLDMLDIPSFTVIAVSFLFPWFELLIYLQASQTYGKDYWETAGFAIFANSNASIVTSETTVHTQYGTSDDHQAFSITTATTTPTSSSLSPNAGKEFEPEVIVEVGNEEKVETSVEKVPEADNEEEEEGDAEDDYDADIDDGANASVRIKKHTRRISKGAVVAAVGDTDPDSTVIGESVVIDDTANSNLVITISENEVGDLGGKVEEEPSTAALSFYLPDPMSDSSVIIDDGVIYSNQTSYKITGKDFLSEPGDSQLDSSSEKPTMAITAADLESQVPLATDTVVVTASDEAQYTSVAPLATHSSPENVLETTRGNGQVTIATSGNAVREASLLSGGASMYSILQGAVDAMWDSRFKEAEDLLMSGNKHKKLPRYALHLAEIHFLVQLMTGRQADRERALEFLKSAEMVAQGLLENKEQLQVATKLCFQENGVSLFATSLAISGRASQGRDATLSKIFKHDVECCLADSVLLRGLFQIIMGREVKGAFNVRKAWKLYLKLSSDLVALKASRGNAGPEFAESELEGCISFGRGFFNVVMSIVPPAFASVLRAIGFTVDRNKGVDTLKKVWESSSLRAPMAALVLMTEGTFSSFGLLRMRSWMLKPKFAAESGDAGDDDEGGNVEVGNTELEDDEWRRLGDTVAFNKEFLRRYPNGAASALMAHYLYRRIGCTTAAVSAIEKSLIRCSPPCITFPAATLFELGTLLCVMQEWSAARSLFQKLWYSNSNSPTTSVPSLSSQHSSRSKKFSPVDTTASDSDLFDMRPIAGTLLVGCMRAELGPTTASNALQACRDTARDVRSEISASLTSGKIKKTRFVKLALSLLDWNLKRGTVHPLLVFCVMYLRRDLAHTAMNPENITVVDNLVTSFEHLTSTNAGLEDAAGKAVTFLIGGTLYKYKALVTRDKVLESRAHEKLVSCLALEAHRHGSGNEISDAAWTIPHAGYEVAELEAVKGRWDRAEVYLLMCLGKAQLSGGYVLDANERGAGESLGVDENVIVGEGRPKDAPIEGERSMLSSSSSSGSSSLPWVPKILWSLTTESSKKSAPNTTPDESKSDDIKNGLRRRPSVASTALASVSESLYRRGESGGSKSGGGTPSTVDSIYTRFDMIEGWGRRCEIALKQVQLRRAALGSERVEDRDTVADGNGEAEWTDVKTSDIEQ
ncbi:hypothetical protein HDU76_002707 [Blyttiomyces sp. JEL0837]|nr:hypothetical protein HDU76_002707 [Blyttiomyces sp. JEL0837]